MNLSAEQIMLIRREVERNHITSPTLRDDLIDHLCCEVENKMNDGKKFQQSLIESIQEIAPRGLTEIQRETNYLLNSKMIPMKKLTYTFGLLAAMAMSFGWVMKILRIAGGNAMFAWGALAFVALFLPLLGVNYFKENSDKPLAEKLKMAFSGLSVACMGLGLLARIMHVPGADEVILLGGILFTFGFLPSFFFTLYKKSIDKPLSH